MSEHKKYRGQNYEPVEGVPDWLADHESAVKSFAEAHEGYLPAKYTLSAEQYERVVTEKERNSYGRDT